MDHFQEYRKEEKIAGSERIYSAIIYADDESGAKLDDLVYKDILPGSSTWRSRCGVDFDNRLYQCITVTRPRI